MINIGVLCPSEIAFRRFMPALAKSENFRYIGIASANKEEWFGEPTEELVLAEKNKASKFMESYGGKIFANYHELLTSDTIDAVYIPLPPALHFKWAKMALENGKHILLEKPFTTSLQDTENLIEIAREKKLAIHENYMFVYHTQIDYINDLISSKEVGDMRLIRIDFGFPFRGANDFRYKKALGGGALFDCGGYTLKLASLLLGKTAKITTAHLNSKAGFDVDLYGNATLVNKNGLTAQVSFGMDNAYKCSVEIWGSTGTIYTNRILTAPDGFEPVVIIRKGNNEEYTVKLPADDTFSKSIAHFERCILNEQERVEHYEEIDRQSHLVEEFERIQ